MYFMKKKSPFSSVLLFPLIALSLTACGAPDSVMNSVEQTEESGFQEPAEAPEPVTEEELRQAIAGLGSDAEATSRKREYYEKLYAMDLFAEEDYLALAQVYAEEGNWKEQRRMLSRALRLYPCAEYAELLSAIVVRGDETETELASLAGQIISALEQQDAAALQGLTGSPQWQDILLEGMSGIEVRTQYREGENLLQITADGLASEITWCGGDGRFFCFSSDGEGAMLGTAALEEGSYSGPVSVARYDGEGNAVSTVQSTLSGGVCIDRILVSHQGTEYEGKLSDTGAVQEEQLKEISEKGGVIYAYDANDRSYLYKENTTVDDFRIDAAYLGLPEYTEWR